MKKYIARIEMINGKNIMTKVGNLDEVEAFFENYSQTSLLVFRDMYGQLTGVNKSQVAIIHIEEEI